ncbi:MAG: hypothetical protein E6230_16110 [Paenibacillus dendritiformis]|uniref:hypothetical protein n=1 Tax=uncultured Paenibacillus sp. TaxID=227322 RepID=UPI0025E048FE|nr:hypothetical protein [uncultured Paenibacillus sp.]MDU5143701.1 hypothetical protein [Paenibacillus dendritiformis]
MKKTGIGLRIGLLAGAMVLALGPGAAGVAAAASGGTGAAGWADRIAAMNQDERAQYFEQAAQRLAEAERKLAQSKALYLDVPYSSIESKLFDAKLAYARAASDDAERDAAQLGQQAAELERFVTEAEQLNTESRKVELRGIRLRVSPSPGDNEAEKVRERLERFKAAHFNAVYLEAAERAGADAKASGAGTQNPAVNPGASAGANGANTIPSVGETANASAKTSAASPLFDAMQVYIDEGAKLGLAVFAGEAGPFGGKPGAAVADIRIGAETDPAAVRERIRQNGAEHGLGAIITGEEAFFAGGYERELWFGLYRSQAVLPERDATKPVRVLLEQMSRKVGAIYVPFGGMTREAAERYRPLLDLLASGLSRTPQWSSNAAASMRDTLIQLREYIYLDTEVKEEVRNRLSEDIDQCVELLEAHLAAHRESGSAS